jgi:hypothetical protein
MRARYARLVPLLLLAALQTTPAAQGAQTAAAPFAEEVARQEAIYSARGQQRPEGYVIDRTLASYFRALPAAFDRSLANLGPNDRWLDIGAGEGRAILDYAQPQADASAAQGGASTGPKGNAVAMSIEDRRTADWHTAEKRLAPSKIQYLHGRPLGEYSTQELGRFQVITDVIGGFSYTTNLSGFVALTLDLLVTGGDFYTLLQDVRSDEGTNKPHYEGAPYLTEIIRNDGAEVKICAWLKSIPCTQVTCELRTDWKPPVEVYHVKKVCEGHKVPNLVPMHYEAGTPPERRFRLQDAPPDGGGIATPTGAGPLRSAEPGPAPQR